MKPPRLPSRIHRVLAGSQARRGLTLLETLVCVAILAMLSLFTLRGLAEARLLRGRARDRALMTLIAQGELDRLRAMPASELSEGVQWREDPAWPSAVKAKLTLGPRPDGVWNVEVQVERRTAGGVRPVQLATIRPGAAR